MAIFENNLSNRYHSDTIAVRAGIETDSQYGSITPPLYLSSNFSFSGFNQPREFDYTRSGNPTRQLLGKTLAELEQGFDGIVTCSGMSAIFLVTQLLKPGDTLVAPHDCYGGSYRLLRSYHEKGIINVKFIDQSNEKELHAALQQKPQLVWIETPSNPLLRLVDIQKVSILAKAQGALVVVDNTFLSPVLQKPLTLGADLVVHSTTKYINGHSDVVGGAVVAKSEALFEELKWWANCTGVTGSPYDSFLTLRGLRTLDVRISRHNKNAQKIAEYLDSHPQVETVYYPGLKSHRDHALATKQQNGYGAMISFQLKGDIEQTKAFLASVKLFSLAESLGGVESLICHPATMTHAAITPEEQATAGITQNLLRISIGIENIEDIIDGLEAGFIGCFIQPVREASNG